MCFVTVYWSINFDFKEPAATSLIYGEAPVQDYLMESVVNPNN